MLTRDQILSKQDIAVKELPVPEWGGSIFIRQLNRAEQDEYNKRQIGDTRMRQDAKAKQQEFTLANMYGHDTYLCICAICDEDGKAIFKRDDIEALKKKNGEVIGRIAIEIIRFSGMAGDVEASEEIKN